MLKINIPNNNIEERKYILNTIFKEFMGLEYKLFILDNTKDWSIFFDDKEIIVEDSFFSLHKTSLTYLKIDSIPLNVFTTVNQFLTESDIPVIYGNDKILITENKIVCGIDIFASSFYMLTRWEEYVVSSSELHERFSSTDSLAFNFNFLNRPVVNEYIEMLWNMFKYLDIKYKRKKHIFKILPSHDVDQPFFIPKTNYLKIKRLIGIFLKNRNLNQFLKVSKEFLLNIDRYDTFDRLIKISNENGHTSIFNFMSCKKTDKDNGYDFDDKLRIVLTKITDSNHKIGFHPSYYTFRNNKSFSLELNKLKMSTNLTNIEEGRQHYLRFEVPYTWRMWNENNLKIDSTMTYHDKEGFRCGICYKFPIFDILERKQLNLKESPLIVMEGTFMKYQNESDFELIYNQILNLRKKVEKYNGEFTILTHNTTICKDVWDGWLECYEKIVSVK